MKRSCAVLYLLMAVVAAQAEKIDLRRTLDGKIVLNHDGFLERLTDGVGETEKAYYEDLRLRDAGAWMGERFENLQVPLFEDALRLARLEELAFIHHEDFSGMNALAAAFQLWDRIGIDPSIAVKAVGSNLPQVAHRAEWILVQGGPAVLPEVRKALGSEREAVRARPIRIVAWQGDTKSLGTLRALQNTDIADADLIAWAIAKIASLHSAL